jgi:acetyltransferase-like isoleucine patch superfamily enzyme
VARHSRDPLIARPRFPVKEIILHGWLPSPLKKALYRLKGYHIGRNVRLALGSVIVGSTVSIGDGTEVGFFSFVRGRTIKLGHHVQIGAATMIDTPHIDIGDGTKLNEQVFIGGLQFPDSRLVVGRNCQIMQMTFINPTRSIVIGDDTGIGGDSLIFGHTSWLSRFEGYPVEFDSIQIGNSVSIAWRVFVLPGTEIGDGAVIGANSLVRGRIPPRCLAIGFPARVVSKEPEFPRVLTAAEREAIFRDIVDEFVSILRADGLECRQDGEYVDVCTRRRRIGRSKRRRLQLATNDGVNPTSDVDVLLSLGRIPDATRATLDQQGVSWLDIAAKERSDSSNDLADETALHLRRHGVRFFRVKPGARS